MKTKELLELSSDELVQKEKDVTEELFNLRFQHATGQLENTMRIPKVRREIARIKTVIAEKRIQS